MPVRGRPRLTPEEYATRVRAYCARYGVAGAPDGLPPFPKGRRETPQHREWMKLYKAHKRLHGASAGERKALLEAQGGICPICNKSVELSDSLDHGHESRRPPALLHQACNQLVVAAESLGPQVVDRVRDYLWPVAPKVRRAKG